MKSYFYLHRGDVLEFFAAITFVILVGFAVIRAVKSNSDRVGTLEKNLNPRAQPFDPKTSKPIENQEPLTGSAFIIDGDTIVIRKIQIRLFGIDAPELNHPYGKKAKWALVNLCKGQKVIAKIECMDTYGRTVAKCFLEDGRDLSAEIVKCGMAIDWPKFSGGKYRALEIPGVRKKLWLADARQKGHMHVWERFEARQNATTDGRG